MKMFLMGCFQMRSRAAWWVGVWLTGWFIGLMVPSLSAVSFVKDSGWVVMAQERVRVEAQVIQLASDQIYFEIAEANEEWQMPEEGELLFVYRESEFLGSLELIAAFLPRVLVRYADSVFPLTRGEVLILEWQTGTESSRAPDDATDLAASETEEGLKEGTTNVPADRLQNDGAESILTRRSASEESHGTDSENGRRSSRTRTPPNPSWSGRLLMGSQNARSMTSWGSETNESVERYSSISYSNLSLRGRDLPGGWAVQAQGRVSYRVQTGSFQNNRTLLNLYNLHAYKTFDTLPLEVQLGRFYNRFEMMHSFWDGAMVQLNDGRWGGGVSAGFQPVRTTEGLSASYPKAGGFMHYNLRTESVRWSVQASAAGVFPSGESFRSYGGIEQKFRYNGYGFDTEFQAHRHPDTSEWRWTRLRLRAFAEISDQLELRASYQQRTSFSPFRDRSSFSNERDEFGITATVSALGLRLIQGVRWNHQPEANSVSLQSRVQWNRSPLWDLSWSVYGYYWDGQARGNSLNAGITASKSMEKWRLYGGLSAYRSNFVNNKYTQGSAYVNADYRWRRDLSVQARYQGTLGRFTQQQSINLSIWKIF